MNHPAFHEAFLADQARRIESNARRSRLDTQPTLRRRENIQVALRLCTVHDTAALEALAALEGRALPQGCFVIAEIDGTLVAAQPLDGGAPLADPFRSTAHVLRLLRLRAEQLEPRHSRLRLFARSWGTVRGF